MDLELRSRSSPGPVQDQVDGSGATEQVQSGQGHRYGFVPAESRFVFSSLWKEAQRSLTALYFRKTRWLVKE